jgi:hypothetical protein
LIAVLFPDKNQRSIYLALWYEQLSSSTTYNSFDYSIASIPSSPNVIDAFESMLKEFQETSDEIIINNNNNNINILEE